MALEHDEQQHGEVTGQVRTAVEETVNGPLGTLIGIVKRFKLWVALGGLLAGTVAWSATHFAPNADQKATRVIVDRHSRQIVHLQDEDRYTHDELHWMRDQMQEVARTVGARLIAPPIHPSPPDGGIELEREAP